MGKSDDSIQRRKSKKSRKKQDDKLSNRIAGIISAKKRRLSGKRRMCELPSKFCTCFLSCDTAQEANAGFRISGIGGMCYSLPTPEDPFNERHGKANPMKKKKKKNQSKKDKNPVKNTSLPQNSDKLEEELDMPAGHMDAPTKFLILCLKNIQDGLQQDGAFNDGEHNKPFFVHTWGIEFWKSFTRGKDIIGTNQAHATTEQISWVAATAADAISTKEKEGLSISSPFLLFLVPSQEKATKVRKICKPLKALGIHTVSLHPGASIDHHIQGLKNCEPEFLISTPERLQELFTHGAIDTSDVSFLFLCWCKRRRKSDESERETNRESDEERNGCVKEKPRVVADGTGGNLRLLFMVSDIELQDVYMAFTPLALRVSFRRLLIVVFVFQVIDGPLTEAGYVDAVESIAKSISGKPQILSFSDCYSNSSSNFLIKKSSGESICRIPLDDPMNGHSMALHICASKLSKISNVDLWHHDTVAPVALKVV
ncbi:hypothetical protein RND71_021925 [Anisodus tanguticus]|uniref:DEAD/DEAH box helicase domain-containing protein n=1 Tax=Anisodus tanguticus TaxID=243964 RepID=A0AAE1VDE8_9SOLA|nr:hypothetical protein RND71_021925 [Anisodus tanguticus]